MTNLKRHFGAGHFDVSIETTGGALQSGTAFVKAVEGGLIKATSVEEAQGPYHLKNRHLSTREIEPLTIEFGMSGGQWALKVLEGVIERQEHPRFNGHVLHGDTNLKEQFSYEFYRALVTEVTLPKLDAKSKEFATIKVKLQPEDCDYNPNSGAALPIRTVDKQKLWSCAAFNFDIGKGELDTEFVTSIEPLTIKVGTKAVQKGGFRLPEYMPTKLELPKLSFTMPLDRATKAINWVKSAVRATQGTKDSAYEKHASITFLDTSRKKELYELELYDVGPENFTILKGDANTESTKMCKFDCYVSRMSILKKKTGFV